MSDEGLLASIGWHFAIGNESLDVDQLGQHRVRDSCPACDETWQAAVLVAADNSAATAGPRMTAEQWARVFAAGQDAIPSHRFTGNVSLPVNLYPVAAVTWALEGMRHECERLAAEETQREQ